jgi:magnesium chelatase family protein
MLLNGPPGAGKTMLARALHGILPPLNTSEMIDITKLHTIAQRASDDIITDRPFRSPHHTASFAALVGGGARPLPGEISLAHHGVLFLDELPEFPRMSLEALRQPLEDRVVHVARAAVRVSYPANFMLVATKNPCPCGYYGDPTRECTCPMSTVTNYQKRLSGPLLDRFDMHLTVRRTPDATLVTTPETRGASSDQFRQLATAARARQASRNPGGVTNAQLSSRQITDLVKLSPLAQTLATQAATQLELSTRSYFKVLRVARTIADLDGSRTTTDAHIAEALRYR